MTRKEARCEMGKVRVSAADLRCINDALESGCDVRIQNVKGGYRIVAERPKILKREPDRENRTEENTWQSV